MVDGSGVLFRLEAMMLTENRDFAALARLVDVGTGCGVPGSLVTCIWTKFPPVQRKPVWQRVLRNLLSLARMRMQTLADEEPGRVVESEAFELPAGEREYQIELGGYEGGDTTVTMYGANLVEMARRGMEDGDFVPLLGEDD